MNKAALPLDARLAGTVLAALLLAQAAPADAQQVVIDFDQLPTATRVSSALSQDATFVPMAPSDGVMTYSTPLGSSRPNFICSAVGSTITCLDPLAVVFTQPVRNLTFLAVGVNKKGRAATVRVFENGAVAGLVDVIGDGNEKHPVLIDLSGFVDVTRVELVSIDDPYGVGWDDFSFEIQHPPTFDPPTPCGQVLTAYAGMPITFRVQASDVVSSENVVLDAGALPPGAVLNPNLPSQGNPAICDVTWTPTLADIGAHAMGFVASDGVLAPVSCNFEIDVQCPSMQSNFGHGLAGSGGFVPHISGSCAVQGEDTAIDVTSGLGGATGCILMGDTPGSFPVFGGKLYVLPTWTHTHVLSGNPGQPGDGSFTLPLHVPASPALQGTTLYFQAGYIDPAAVRGISLTDALAITLC